MILNVVVIVLLCHKYETQLALFLLTINSVKASDQPRMKEEVEQSQAHFKLYLSPYCGLCYDISQKPKGFGLLLRSSSLFL